MGINYAGGTYRYQQVDASTTTLLATAIKDEMLAADWTSDTSIKAKVTLTFTGAVANNSTVTLAGQVYTFKTALTPAAFEVLLGVDAASCASNLNDAINDISANEGITYGTGTTAHATLESVIASPGVLTIRAQTAGLAGNGFAVSESHANTSFDVSTGQDGGFKLISGRTPHGLQIKVQITAAGSQVWLRVMDINETATSQINALGVAASRLLEVVACQYQVFIFLLGSSATAGTIFSCSVPYLRTAHRPIVITSVADDGTGQYQVETATPHGLPTGQHVYISGATASGVVLSSLNGDHVITNVDATHYNLDASVYETGYDADSAVVANARQISRAYWCEGHLNGPSNRTTFRNSMVPAGSIIHQSLCINQYAYTLSGSGQLAELGIATRAGHGTGSVPPKAFGGYALQHEPVIGWPITSSVGVFQWVGELWNSRIVLDDIDMDTQELDYDGHNWINYTDNHNTGSLVLVTTQVTP